jgi:chaperonin GroES
MKIRPLHDRIVIKRKTEEDRTAGGLYIPESAKERPTQATVVAVGKGRIQEDGSVRPLGVKVGDTVLFGKYAGNEIKMDGEEYLIIREEDVLAVYGE